MKSAFLFIALLLFGVGAQAQQVPVPRPVSTVLQYPLESDQWPNSPLMKNKPVDPMSTAVIPPMSVPDTFPPPPLPVVVAQPPAHTGPVLMPIDSIWLEEMSPLNARGVEWYDHSKTANGITLLDHIESSKLIDMEGNILANLPFGLPNFLPDGTIVAMMDTFLVKLDADLDIIWKKSVGPIHHEITVDENGCIYLLSHHVHQMMGLDVRFDVVKIFSSNGAPLYQWCPFDHLEEFVAIISKSAWDKTVLHPYEKCKNAFEYLAQDPESFFFKCSDVGESCKFEFNHFNSIQVLPANNVSKTIPAFKKGNLLLSFNLYACYGILDTSTGKIEWTGYLTERATLHTPLLTPAGTILVFENSTHESEWLTGNNNAFFGLQGASCEDSLLANFPPVKNSKKPEARMWASATEYDPITNKKLWEYTDTPKESMQADGMGSTQRLENGNTLICATADGQVARVFEITPEKEIVWVYSAPLYGQDSQSHAAHYRAKRISAAAAQKMTSLFNSARYVREKEDSHRFRHYVGELYQGGIIVSLRKTGMVEHGLIASLKDLSPAAAWSNVTMQKIGPTAQSVNDGQANTMAIINQAGHVSSAALLCHDYSAGGYADWYLPADWELQLCYNADIIVSEVLGDENGFQWASYWSSTELSDGSGGAWAEGFGYGLVNGFAKSYPYSVRAVRRF